MALSNAIVILVNLPGGETAPLYLEPATTKVGVPAQRAKLTLVQENGRATVFEVNRAQGYELRKAMEIILREDDES